MGLLLALVLTQALLAPAAPTLRLDGPALCLRDLSWQDANGTWQRWQWTSCP